jgi:amino acid adenylation domain-containing protein
MEVAVSSLGSSGSDPAYRRPISPTERAQFLATPPGTPVAVQFVVRGTGRVDPEALATAVRRASEACPGARVAARERHWVDTGETPPVRRPDPSTLDLDQPERCPALRAPLLHDGGPGCEVLLFGTDDPVLVFRAHHAIMDAQGVLLWAREVFRALRGEDPLPATDADTDVEIAGRHGPVRHAPPSGLDWPSALGQPAQAGEPRWFWRRITVDGRHPALVAKLAVTIAELRRLPAARFHVPVDLRRHEPGLRSTGNLALSLTLDVDAGSSWERVHERLLTALAERRELAASPPPEEDPLPLDTLLAMTVGLEEHVRAQDRYLSTGVLSHFGALDLDELSGGGFAADTAFSLPSFGLATPLVVDAVEAGRRTEIVLGWHSGEDTERRAADLLAGIEDRLSPRIVRDWPGNRTDRPLERTTVTARFAERVRRTPDAAAVRGPDGEMSYAELDRAADVVAAEIQARGVRPGSVVGLLADRSARAIVAIWGVLRAGCAYLPLDVAHPDSRVTDLLADAGAPLCLVERAFAERPVCPRDCAPVVLDDLPAAGATPEPVAVSPNDLAYVIYTSGSTGRPKGVEIEHLSLVNYVDWAAREFEIDERTALPWITSLSFDVSGTSIFPPLLAGGTTLLVPGELNHRSLRDMLCSSGATAITLTPSHLDLIGRLDIEPVGVRMLIVIGEQLRMSVARRAREQFGPDCVIVNEYGPTEATIGCTAHRYTTDRDTDAAVPIGVPGDNTRVFLLDADGRHVPPGEVGELYLAGAQLARGYRGRPALNRERFGHLADGTRVYRTGDLCRLLPDGELAWLGRVDDQVKVLGHRIEPAEIAAVLEEHVAVARAVVVARERAAGAERVLCGYVLPAGPVDERELLDHLADRLPRYMVPETVLTVSELPTTVNGKVDVRALPDPFAGASAAGPAGRPADEVQAAVATVWARVLRLPEDRLAAQADFHQLGGNSVSLLAMVAAVSEELLGADREEAFLGRLREIIAEPTVEHVSDMVRELRAAG